jgi:hypothetical protein
MVVIKAKKAVSSPKELFKRPAASSRAQDAEGEEKAVEALEDGPAECEAEGPARASKKRPAAVPTAPAGKTLRAARAKRVKVLEDARADEGEEEADAAGDDGEEVLRKPAAAAKAAKKKKTIKKGSEVADTEQDLEATVASRKKELKGMAAADLKTLVLSKGLEAGAKADNVEAVLALEARERAAEARKLEELQGIERKRREEFASMQNADLKALCEKKGLKQGGTKDCKIERLLAKAKEDGEIDEAYNAMAREARRSNLMSMDKEAVLEECARLGVDPLVKEVMVERILFRESWLIG